MNVYRKKKKHKPSYAVMWAAKKRTGSDSIDDDNPYIDQKGRRKDAVVDRMEKGMYPGVIKPLLDRILSFCGLLVLAPLYMLISVAIYIDDPGPVLFTQKRIGKDKRYIQVHKFRSMKMNAPHDVPTHQLENPKQYITRTGKFLRRTSLDELPQIWDIFRGKMSIIGPRPALWNQDDLVKEREKYGANDVLPGLTGLAQISGRDELEIPVKAEIDGKYVKILNGGGIAAFFMDCKCFIETIRCVIKHDGVVEGGTGEMSRNAISTPAEEEAGFEEYGFLKIFNIDQTLAKKVLITGADSYIGKSFESWAKEWYPNLSIDTLDMIGEAWKSYDFTSYDCVLHVAGIAHADVRNVSKDEKAGYYAVNSDLAIETCRKAKESGVRQFILMSSMIVYGDSAPYRTEKIIDEHTIPSPVNFYGDSKWQADKGVREWNSPDFCVSVLRLPMIYGKGSKGNYQRLSKMAKCLPFFPAVDNSRSMLHIDNLCEFLCKLILSGESGIYFPQNAEYSNTSKMAAEIASAVGRSMATVKLFTPAVMLFSRVPGRVGRLVNKAFGNSVYSQKLSIYRGLDYRVHDLHESIILTENPKASIVTRPGHKLRILNGKKILLIALSGYPTGIIKKMEAMGAEVDYINDKPNDGVICKTLGRYKVGFYQKVINNYYTNSLKSLRTKNYDFILVIRGEYTPTETLKRLKRYYPNSRLILYMWDGMHKLNTKGIEKKWPYYDRVYTFDRMDYEEHKDELSFLPLYYYEEYLPKKAKEPNSNDFTYDLSFIGTGHGDRIRIVKDVTGQCERKGLNCFSYFFMPHPLVYLWNKLTSREFKSVRFTDIGFKMMPFEKLYRIYADSKCVVDVENTGQHGLTMRSIEILGLRRKLITTNKDIVNYDFYNANNIMVLDREKPIVDMSFFERPYETLDESIYHKYSLENWILEVLK